jgi:predicted cupin superfamily sugar epimerase
MSKMDTEVNAQYWAQKLDLKPHPEGGWYKEVFRDGLRVRPQDGLQTMTAYSAATGIYFLMDSTHFSAFHRIGFSEGWHFYDGTGICIYILHADGSLQTVTMGRDVEKGEVLQYWIPPKTWFASRVEKAGGYALCGCTVAPGFEFTDFELAQKEQLLVQFPQHHVLIEQLTLA